MKSVAHVFFAKEFAEECRRSGMAQDDVERHSLREWKRLGNVGRKLWAEQRKEAIQRYEEEKRLEREIRRRDTTHSWEYSGFLFFIHRKYGAHHTEGSAEDQVATFAKMWRALGDDERQRFREEGLEARKRSGRKRRSNYATDPNKVWETRGRKKKRTRGDSNP